MAAKQVEAKDHSVAAGRDVNIGISAEALLDTLKEDLKKAHKNEGLLEHLLEQQKDKVAELGQALEVNNQAVLGFLKILGEQDVGQDEIEPTLLKIAERHRELVSRLEDLPPSNDDPDITKLREEASKAIEDADYDLADSLLQEAEDIDDRALREQQETLDRRKLSKAQTRSERGELERARLNYRKAAEHFAEAASLVPNSDPDHRFGYLSRQASVLFNQGDEFGDNPALSEAIALYHQLVANYLRNRVPLDWARTQLNLGNALWAFGQRESDTGKLEQAVEAFHAALEEYTRDRVPLDWARTQNNLGAALWALGQRDSGTARLEQAVEAFQAALEKRTRDRVSLDWAMTQMNLGAALSTLGQRENGTARLEQAVEAFQAALEEWTRERVPLQWAWTQENIGLAYKALAEKSQDQAPLLQGIEAIKASLEVYEDGRVAYNIDKAKRNLAGAEALLATFKEEAATK